MSKYRLHGMWQHIDIECKYEPYIVNGRVSWLTMHIDKETQAYIATYHYVDNVQYIMSMEPSNWTVWNVTHNREAKGSL